MEKLLKALTELVPLLALYPRWFQILLAVTVTSVVLCVAIGVGLYPVVAKLKARNDVASEVATDISVTSADDPEVSLESDTKLTYVVRTEGDVEIVEPHMEYLQRLAAGGPIRPLNYNYVPFEWDYPTIDVKIVNNSKKTIFVTTALFKVSRSRLDTRPILVVVPDSYQSNARHIRFANEGWGDLLDAQLNFNVRPAKDDTASAFDRLRHTISIGTIAERASVDISEALSAAGADLRALNDLRPFRTISDRNGTVVTVMDSDGREIEMSEEDLKNRRRSALGPFEGGAARVDGELSYRERDLAGSTTTRRVKFSTIVWLFNQMFVGAPAPPSYTYSVRLDVSGSNYERRANVSHVLKPGDADRFGIRVGVEKSSRHLLELKLLCNDGLVALSKPMQVDIFVPRSGARYVDSESTEAQE